MDTITRNKINVVYSLLETLSNLSITYLLDKVFYDEKTGKITPYYAEGTFKHAKPKTDDA